MKGKMTMINHDPALRAITEVRDLAIRLDTDAIEHCMEMALQGLSNPCYAVGDQENVMTMLAKASFVRKQIRRGIPVAIAIRELGKRMRLLRSFEEE